MRITSELTEHQTHPNSLISYKHAKANGQFTNLQQCITHLLGKHGPLTRVELSTMMVVKEGSLCQPLKQMIADGEIEESGNKINPESNMPNVMYGLCRGQGRLL